MFWTVLALGGALLVPLATGGSYTRLFEKPWRWGSFLVAAIAIQIAIEVVPIAKSHAHGVGFGLLVASYVLLLGFCARNALIKGMTVVFIGVALNAIAITANQGMPVRVPRVWQGTDRIATTVKHHPRRAGDHLLALTDVIVLRSPFTAISFGDLIVLVGLYDVMYNASRRPRRRPSVPRKRAAVPPLLMPDDWHADATPRAFDEEPVVDIRREDEQVEAEHAHDSGADIWAVRAADG